MKAIGIIKSVPAPMPDSLIEFDTPVPVPEEHDLLIAVKAVSVNPVDYRIRRSIGGGITLDTPKILGWDAAGIVTEAGAKVSLFKKGDAVFYAGDITRNGSNAEYQLVDERIAGRMPANLSFEEAASVPLTALTAWESVFERLHIGASDATGKKILIIGGAGGVGSIAIQLLKKLTPLKVITTASRKETKKWCIEMGADQVIGHNEIIRELAGKNGGVDYILNLNDTDRYWKEMAEVIRPFGQICCIVPPRENCDLKLLYNKSVSFSWELMFTRSLFATDDIVQQHKILNEVAALYEKNVLKSYLGQLYQGLKAENFRLAHELLESGRSIGKIAVIY